MNTSNVRLVDPPPTDPQQLLTGHFRDAIALRCSKADIRFPAVCDLEAKVLAAVHTELRGVASSLAGTHTAENWRERLRGERIFPLGDLCRLAMNPTKEGRAAAFAALSTIAEAAGYTLVSTSAVHHASLIESAISAASAATEALSDVARSVADGQVDPSEAASLRQRASALRHAAAAFEGAALKSDLPVGKR